eukprot:jgi/Bigna1/74836/fgenesh1_pg.31_\
MADPDMEEDIFAIERLEWSLDPRYGRIASLSSGDNILLMGTESGHVIRFSVLDDRKIPIDTKSREPIHKVFLEPNGEHGLVSTEKGSNFYIPTSKKQRTCVSIKGLKNVIIESVAWNKVNVLAGGNSGGEGSGVSSCSVLIGTNTGAIYELLIEDGKEKVCKRLWNIGDAEMPIMGLQMDLFPGESSKFFVMAATPTRHYQFVGGPTFEALFARYVGSRNRGFQELPGNLDRSELHFQYNAYPHGTAQRVAWLTQAGIFQGDLVYGAQNPGEKFACANRLSKAVVYDVSLRDDAKRYGLFRGLAADLKQDTFWMFSDRCVFEVRGAGDSGGGGEQGDFDGALKHCRSDSKKTQIILSKQAYLLLVLSSLKATAETQLTMVGTWLTELYLDELRRLDPAIAAAVDEGDQKKNKKHSKQKQSSQGRAEKEKASERKRATTFGLISSHGRSDELVHYAEVIGDRDWLVRHSLAHGRPKMALLILAKYWTRFSTGKVSDPTVHNYLISLLVKQKKDDSLIRFIVKSGPKPIYDVKSALRLCYHHNKIRACSEIHKVIGEFEEATKVALKINIQLAQLTAIEAEKAGVDPEITKKLWLLVARHVINKERGDVKKATQKVSDILKHCSLSIEEVLPYFPDFVQIGGFKSEVVKSLEAYNQSIRQLKIEMDRHTETATKIRKDIDELQNQKGYIPDTRVLL